MVPKSPAAAWPSHGASNGSAQKPPAFAWNWSLTNVGETAVAPAAARTPAAGRGCDTTPAVAAAGPPVAVMATIASRAAGPVRPARIRVRLVMLVFLPLLAQPGVRITPGSGLDERFPPVSNGRGGRPGIAEGMVDS